jgi:hypothetical protein
MQEQGVDSTAVTAYDDRRRTWARTLPVVLLIALLLDSLALVTVPQPVLAEPSASATQVFTDTVDVPANRIYRSFDVEVTADDLGGEASGTLVGRLEWDGPADLDLFVRSGTSGPLLTSSTTSVAPEQLSITVTPGTYRFTVKGVSGATPFTLHTEVQHGEERTFLGTSQAGGQSWRTYGFPVTEPGLLTARLDWDGAADLELYLRTPSGVLVRTSKTPNNPEAYSFEAATTGTYEVVVSSSSGAAPFAASVLLTTDPTERVHLGVVGHNGKIYESFDLTVPERGTLTASLAWDASADLDLFLRPVASDGSLGAIVLSSATSVAPEQLSFDVTPGTYRLIVKATTGATAFELTTSLQTGLQRRLLGTSQVGGQNFRTVTLPVDEPSLLTATLDWAGGADLSLYVRDPSGALAKLSKTTSKPEQLSLPVDQGDHEIVVSSESGAAAWLVDVVLQPSPTERTYLGTIGDNEQVFESYDLVIGADDLAADGTGTLTAMLGWQNADADLDLLVRRLGGGDPLVGTSVTSLTPEQLSIDVTAGTYRLFVRSTSGATPFELQTTVQSGTDRVFYGTSDRTSGQVFRSYPFRTAGAGTIDVELAWLGDDGNLAVELLGPGGRLDIATGAARPKRVQAEVPAAGTYEVKVWAVTGKAAFAAATSFELDTTVPSNQPPTIDAIDDQDATEGAPFGPVAVTATDPDGDDLEVSVAGLPAGVAFDAASSVIAGTPELGTAADGPYTVVVTADDGELTAQESFVLTVAAAPVAATCPLVSIAGCDTVAVELPFVADWTTSSGLPDANGVGTGFTMVDPPSERIASSIDGTVVAPSFEDAPGYEPERLSVDATAGTLTIAATKGIAYSYPPSQGPSNGSSAGVNSQLNTLGVGVEAADRVLTISTTIAPFAFPTTNHAQQAGVWFGLGEDDYVKLVVANAGNGQRRVQLLREIGAIAKPGSSYELNSATFSSNQPITLELVIDGIDHEASATYTVGSGTPQALVDPLNTVSTTSQPIPIGFTQGIALDDGDAPVSFAGLFATSRNASNASQLISPTFTAFSVVADDAPTDPDPDPDPDPEPPSSPTGLSAEAGPGAVTLSWEAVDGDDVLGYEVVRSTTLPVLYDAPSSPPADLVTGTSVLDTDVVAGGTYHYAVVAWGAGGPSPLSSTVTAVVPEDPTVACPLVTIAACSTVPVELPFTIDWTETGGLVDADGIGTGFTMVDPPSARLGSAVDPQTSATPTYTDAPGYEPSRLTVDDDAGTLTIASTKGIQYRTNVAGPTGTTNTNSLLNALGVGIAPGDGALTISAQLDELDFPNNAALAQQAGLWFGIGEDDYVKLVVQNQSGSNAQVQLAVESGGLLDPNDLTQAVVSPNFTDAVDVELELTVDPEDGTVSARYRLGSGAFVELAGGAALTLPSAITDGVTLDDGSGPVSFAGVFATSRNATQPAHYIDATYSSFEVTRAGATDPDPDPVAPFDVAINFQSADAPVPTGFLRDHGEPFGARTGDDQGDGLSYGWVSPTTGSPLSLVGNGRDRTRPGIAPELNTMIHLQYSDVANGQSPPNVMATGAWEIEVEDGVYEVTVVAGDQAGNGGIYDSTHVVNVEAGVAIEAFQGTPAKEFEVATVVTSVTDGRLRLDPIGGSNTKLAYVTVERLADQPTVTSVFPENRSDGAAIDGGVSASISVPGAGVGVDPTSLAGNVALFDIATGAQVPTTVGTSGGNDVIALDPNDALAELTAYRFVVGDGVLSEDGAPFAPFTSVFTTGVFGGDPDPGGPGDPDPGEPGVFTPLTDISFEKVELPAAQGRFIASMQFGPDGKLYVSTIGQGLYRYDVAEDGTIGNEQLLGLQGRAVIGLVFDEGATADDLGVWITHATANINNEQAQWGSKVSYLSGPDLGTVTDVFVGLPRSLKDHLTNSMAYGPGGALYFLQGSNQAAGDLDSAWGTRGEQLLTAALLRFDPAHPQVQAALGGGPAIDVQTADGGSYDPFAPDAPLTLYATGIRNAYDLVHHTNGHLYVPTNGTAGGANSPGVVKNADGTFTRTSAASGQFGTGNGQDVTAACTARRIDGQPYTGPNVPAIANHPTQRDFLYRVDEGGYYGHPNPERCEWVLNEGSTGSGFGQGGSKYPVGTFPDPNYRGFAFDFEFNKSVNGVIEYRSATFGGQLDGWLVAVRFSNNNDLIFLQPGDDGGILGAQTQLGIPGVAGTTMTGVGGFKDPLEIVEDPSNGNLYVNQYDRGGSDQKLFLLRVPEDQRAPVAGVSVDAEELIFSAANRGTSGSALITDPTNVPQSLTITNAGDQDVELSAALSGSHASTFTLGTVPATLASGASVAVPVNFVPAGTDGVLLATLTIEAGPQQLEVGLYGLAAFGLEGGREPTLLQVFQTLGLSIDPGWTSLADGVQPIAKGDEILEPLFEKVGSGPVTMTAVAAYAPQELLPFGWYTSDGTLNEVGAIQSGQLQTLYPKLARGGSTFDPGSATFGFYYDSNAFNRVGYTEDSRNDGGTHRARIYPVKDRAGAPVANSYVVAFEDAFNGDYNDYVFVVANVTPAGQSSGPDPDPVPTEAIRINFQNASAPVPDGYLLDHGQPFGPRTGPQQGQGLSYGWLDQATENPIDLSVSGTIPGNGRTRGLASDPRLDSLMHMQAGDLTPPAKPAGTFNGVDAYAFFELALPPGAYEVTVAAGDPAVNSDPESHTISVEGETVIDGFVPSGAAGAASRSTTATTVVDVTDGFLTIDANGGSNTKINYVDVVPLGGQGLTTQVNFQTAGAPTPDGWLADTGLAFDTTRGYGWVVAGTSTPVGRVNATRQRTSPAGDPLLQTFNIMQNQAVTSLTNGDWHMVLPNGVYTVEVAVGDADFFDSVHSIAVNGVDIISEYVPSGLGDFEVASAPVEVTDGLLTVAAGFNGVNTKIAWIRVVGSNCEGDCIAPTIAVDVDGPIDPISGDYANRATVTVNASDLGGSGLASVTVSVDGGPAQAYDGPVTVEGAGSRTVTITATDGAGNVTTRTVELVIVEVEETSATLAIANMDATRVADEPIPGFYEDWLVMHRINANTTTHKVHDVATLQLRNTDTEDDLLIGSLELSTAQFALVDPPALPFTIAPGGSLDLQVAFVASGGQAKSVRSGTLTIVSNDLDTGPVVVELRGLYMSQPEGNNENTATQLAQAFGYTTAIGEPLTSPSSSPLAGDEVRSAFWERANPTQPVHIRQIAAFHGCCTSQDWIQLRNQGGGNLMPQLAHAGPWGQTILPVKAGANANNPATWDKTETSVSPTVPFQIVSANYSTTASANPNGQLGVRLWPIKDRDGAVVPHAWYVIQDFVASGCGSGSANCDYNDNVYIVTNIVPQGQRDTQPPAAPTGLTADRVDDGPVQLSWEANTEEDLAFYDVQRAANANGPWATIVTATTATTAVDTSAPSSGTLHYRVIAEDTWGNRSTPSTSVSVGGGTVDPTPPGGTTVRLNAGGPAVTTGGVTWSADTHFVGGKSYSNANVTAIAGTDDDVLYLTERSATANLAPFSYAIPVEDGSYEVRLHLAEIWFGAPNSGPNSSGSRVFSVTAEGQPFLTDYDLIADVGPLTATVKSTEVTVTDGVLDLAFTASVNQAKVSAIEVLPLGSEPVVPGTETVRINAGGSAQTVDGVQWSTCTTVANCSGWVSGGFAFSQSVPITNVPPGMNQTIFHSEWTGGQAGPAGTIVPPGTRAFGFDIPVTNGAYTVRLHFAELNKPDPGTRVFDVEVEGDLLLEGLDLTTTAGLGVAVVHETDVDVTDGVVTIDLIRQVENAKISAIEVLPRTPGAGSPPPSAPTPPAPDPEPDPDPTPPNPTTDEFAYSSIAQQPIGVNEVQGELVDGTLYSFGGFDSQKSCCTPTSRSYAYAPASNSWSAIAPLPHLAGNGQPGTGVTHAATAVDDDGGIYLVGGYISGNGTSGQTFGTVEVYRYDTASNAYTRLPDLPQARASGAAAFIDGKLYHVGGTNQARTQDPTTHWVLDVAGGATAWTTGLAPLPEGRNHPGMQVLDGRFYVVGGQTGHDGASTTKSDVWSYDPATDSWTTHAPLPQARGHITSTTFELDGRIVVAGGMPSNGVHSAQVHAYDPVADTWTSLTSLPTAKSGGVAGAFDGGFLYSAGAGGSTTAGWKAAPVTVEPASLSLGLQSFGPAPGVATSVSLDGVQDGAEPDPWSAWTCSLGIVAVRDELAVAL